MGASVIPSTCNPLVQIIHDTQQTQTYTSKCMSRLTDRISRFLSTERRCRRQVEPGANELGLR